MPIPQNNKSMSAVQDRNKQNYATLMIQHLKCFIFETKVHSLEMEEGTQSREFTAEIKLFMVLEKEKWTTNCTLLSLCQGAPSEKSLPSNEEISGSSS